MRIFGVIMIAAGLLLWASENWVTGYTPIKSAVVVFLVLTGITLATHRDNRPRR